jgi:DNA replication licensing factor MCM3
MFRDRLARLFTTAGEDQLYFTQMVESINEGLGNDALFGSAEAQAACQIMSDDNELMVSDGIVYRI